MRVLVTGASGFLGAWMCRKLQSEGVELIILARPKSDLSELEGIRFTKADGDITNLESVLRASKEVGAVFHLAGLIGYSRAQRADMERVNVDGTKNVIAACRTNKVKRLIHMSSVVTVGASFDGSKPLNEESPYNLEHLNLGYFETKRAAEVAVVSATKSGDIDSVILNPATMYGPGDAKKGSRGTQLKVARGKFPFYTSGGVNVLHVKDAVDATFEAWQKGRSGERYILASENITIKTLFETIAAAAQVPAPKIHLPNGVIHLLGKVGDTLERFGKKGPINSENAWTSTLYHWFDSTKARRELGLKLTPAKIAISESVLWMKENGLLTPNPD